MALRPLLLLLPALVLSADLTGPVVPLAKPAASLNLTFAIKHMSDFAERRDLVAALVVSIRKRPVTIRDDEVKLDRAAFRQLIMSGGHMPRRDTGVTTVL